VKRKQRNINNKRGSNISIEAENNSGVANAMK